MSSNSLRHVIRRREHRERAQPAARAQRFGLLEKHKDYKLRAVDYHRKQDAIRTMKEKASFRNEDEFYMKMNSSQTKNGVHHLERKSNLTPATVKMMKGQDLNYLISQRNADARKIEKAKQNMHFLMEDDENYDEAEDDEEEGGFDDDEDEDDAPPKKKSKNAAGSAIRSKHVIFVDKQKDLKSFSPANYFDTAPELVNRTFNRVRQDQLQQGSIVVNNTQNQTLTQREKAGMTKGDSKGDSALQIALKESKSTAAAHVMQARADQSLLASYSEIASRLQRKRKLDDAVAKLQLEKNLAGKGARKRIVKEDKFGEVDEKKVVYKWKKERKR